MLSQVVALLSLVTAYSVPSNYTIINYVAYVDVEEPDDLESLTPYLDWFDSLEDASMMMPMSDIDTAHERSAYPGYVCLDCVAHYGMGSREEFDQLLLESDSKEEVEAKLETKRVMLLEAK